MTGWDAAGVVERASADGSGPRAGARVVGLVDAGAWAELAAIPTNRLLEIPDRIPDAQAATLPTAGMTALRALEVAGLVLGRRVLVTGATGGVGRMAIQLARESGAREQRLPSLPVSELNGKEAVERSGPSEGFSQRAGAWRRFFVGTTRRARSAGPGDLAC